MIMHLPMVRIVLPSCVIYAYSIISPIVKWDIFEDFSFNPSNWFSDNNSKSYGIGLNNQVKLLGYNSNNIINNLGSITIFLNVYILKLIIFIIIRIFRQ